MSARKHGRSGGPEEPNTPLSTEDGEIMRRGYEKNLKPAIRAAAAFSSNPMDVVHEAVAVMIGAATRATDPEPLARDEQVFSMQFMGLVRRIGRSTVREGDTRDVPIHSFWGECGQPRVSARKSPARELIQDHKRLDTMPASDLVDGEPRDEPQPRPKHRRPAWIWPDRVQLRAELSMIFDEAIKQLARMQRRVIELELDGVPREEAAKRLRISVKTYDIHLAAAKENLRHLLVARWPSLNACGRTGPFDVFDVSEWTDVLLGR
jgi:hypothetical protein